VIDGELVALREGRLDFAAMSSPPAARARAAVTVYFVAFDLLAYGPDDLRRRPYADRRDQLSALLAGVAPPLQQAPATTDRSTVLSWISSAQAEVGIEGVVAKDRTASYPAERSWAWRKTRYHEMTDCVVVGVTGGLARPDALVLAQPDTAGALRTVGVSLPLTTSVRAQLAGRLAAAGAPQHLPGLITRPHRNRLPTHDPCRHGRDRGRRLRRARPIPAPTPRPPHPPRRTLATEQRFLAGP
jgi:ATP-dependent DNA ligase